MRAWQASFLRRFYRSLPGWIDGTTAYHQMCRRYIQNNATTLELGPGSQNKTSAFLKSVSAKLVGLDVDKRILANPHLDQAVLYDGGRFPFRDESFDIVMSDYVNEHLKDPVAFCQEIHRVLVDGGMLIFRTPNLFHYVSIVGKLMPHIVSLKLANWLRDLPKGTPEPYPKYYRFNTKKRCIAVLNAIGFNVIEYEMIEKEPSYGMCSRILFIPFMIYERVVNATDLLSMFRANILCIARKVERG